MRRKEKKENESAEPTKEVKNGGKKDPAEASSAEAVASSGAGQNGDFEVEPMELPPFEIITGYVLLPAIWERMSNEVCFGDDNPAGSSLGITNV